MQIAQKDPAMKLLKIILCFILPPGAAFLQVGVTTHFWISIIAMFCGWLPGVAHSLWLVLTDQKGAS